MDQVFILPTVLILIGFLSKLFLWLRIKQGRRINFFVSFILFFSNNNWYEVESKNEKIFMRLNTFFNIITYIGLLLLIFFYIMDTNDINGLIPTRKEARDYQIN